MKSNLHARLVVNDGKLDFPSKPQETRFNAFLKELDAELLTEAPQGLLCLRITAATKFVLLLGFIS